jgi:hypothetical protein
MGMIRRRAPVLDAARPTRAELRRWQAGYARAAARQRTLATTDALDETRTRDVTLALFDAALAPGSADLAHAQN